MLLAAILSDTVILDSPTTTEHNHYRVVDYLEELLELDAPGVRVGDVRGLPRTSAT